MNYDVFKWKVVRINGTPFAKLLIKRLSKWKVLNFIIKSCSAYLNNCYQVGLSKINAIIKICINRKKTISKVKQLQTF